MKKNVGSQLISAQMTSATDGSDQTTGTCNVAVEIDGAAGTGGTATHIANGKWEYAPIQADTNGDYLTFQFVISGAITSTLQVYTDFPQTVDNDVLAAGATGFAAIDTVVDNINTQVGTAGAGLTNIGTIATVTTLTNLPAITTDWLTAAGTAADFTTEIQANLATSAAQTTAQNDLDLITGSDGATLATAQALYAPSKAGDAMTLTAAGVDLIWDETMVGHGAGDTAGLVMNEWQNGGRLDLILDTIAVDTTTDIPALIATAQSDLDIITGATGVNLLAATQTSIDNIETDTGTTLDGKINTIGTDTAATQVLAAGATGFAAIDTVVDAVKAKTDSLTFTIANEVDANTVSAGVGVFDASSLATDAVNEIRDAIYQGTLTEGYAGDLSAMTLEESLHMIWSAIAQFAIVGTDISTKKLDGTTEAMSFLLDDDTNPTSRNRN